MASSFNAAMNIIVQKLSISGEVGDVAALEACIGKTPGPMHLKVIDHLDDGASQWLAASTLMFAGFTSSGSVGITLAGGKPGFVMTDRGKRLRIPVDTIDNPELAVDGAGFGSLLLIPTIGETLRINGRVALVGRETIEIEVAECYVHCAKALIRSNFWQASPDVSVPSDPAGFLAACRLIALATVDRSGRADVSPKAIRPGC